LDLAVWTQDLERLGRGLNWAVDHAGDALFVFYVCCVIAGLAAFVLSLAT